MLFAFFLLVDCVNDEIDLSIVSKTLIDNIKVVAKNYITLLSESMFKLVKPISNKIKEAKDATELYQLNFN